MRKNNAFLSSMVLTCVALGPAQAIAGDDKAAEAKAQVGKLQEGFVDAFSQGSKAVGSYLEPLLSDDVVITDNSGKVYEKRSFLAAAKAIKRIVGALAMEQKEAKIHVYGETSVVTGLIVAGSNT